MHHFVNQKEAQNLGSKEFLEKIDWIVFNSHWNFEKFVYQYKIPESKSIVIRNAIEKISFHEKPKDKISLIINKKDGGIWDAMNIGLEKATGDIVGFLNADDFYYNGALKVVNNYFLSHKIDFLFGTVDKYKLMHGYKPWKSKWSFGFYTSHSIGFFIKTEDHKKIGYYMNKNPSAF